MSNSSLNSTYFDSRLACWAFSIRVGTMLPDDALRLSEAASPEKPWNGDELMSPALASSGHAGEARLSSVSRAGRSSALNGITAMEIYGEKSRAPCRRE